MTSSFIDEMYTAKDRAQDFAHVAPVRGGRKRAKPRPEYPSEPIPKKGASENPRSRAARKQIDLRNYFIAAFGGSLTVKPLPPRDPLADAQKLLRKMRPLPELPPQTYPEPRPLVDEAQVKAKKREHDEAFAHYLRTTLVQVEARLK